MSEADTKTPAKKAMDYIDSLGAHTVHQDALQARSWLDVILTELGQLRDARRNLESKKYDRELEVLQDETSKHPDHSVAALDRHLKVVYGTDEILTDIRYELVTIHNKIDGLELDQRMAETDIKIATSRLNELGGLFQLMAVIKQADNASKASEAKNNDDPWRSQ